MTRQRGHLRLVEPLEPESEPCPTCTGPTRRTVGMVCPDCGTDYGRGTDWLDPANQVAVDTEVVFTCDECGRVYAPQVSVRAAWCTGDRQGKRTHPPTEMRREEHR